MPWFNLTPVQDERIFETARHVHRYEMHLPASADVFAGEQPSLGQALEM